MKNYIKYLLSLMIVLSGLSICKLYAAVPELSEKDGGVEPFVKDFKYIGGANIEFTYGWAVKAKIEKSWEHIFVHFTKDDSPDIAWQNDHSLPSPAGEWKEGSFISDGPYDITLPATAGEGVYYIRIGMYIESGERNGNMKGLGDKENRIIIGKLILKGMPGNITDVKFETLKGMKKPDSLKNK